MWPRVVSRIFFQFFSYILVAATTYRKHFGGFLLVEVAIQGSFGLDVAAVAVAAAPVVVVVIIISVKRDDNDEEEKIALRFSVRFFVVSFWKIFAQKTGLNAVAVVVAAAAAAAVSVFYAICTDLG